MFKRIPTYYLKYMLWSLLIVGLTLFTPIPIYLGKFFVEKKYNIDISTRQITGGLAQGITIDTIKFQNLNIEKISTNSIFSITKKVISFSKINVQIPEHSDIKINVLELKSALFSCLKEFSIESNSISVNGKNYNLQIVKKSGNSLVKLFNLDDFIELAINSNDISGVINVKNIGSFSHQYKGSLNALVKYIPISNSLPYLTLQLNSDYLKFNEYDIYNLKGAVKGSDGKISGIVEHREKKSHLELELSQISDTLSKLTTRIQSNVKKEEVHLVIQKDNNNIFQISFDKSKERHYQGILKSLSKISLLVKYKNNTLEIQSIDPEQSNQINGYINTSNFYGYLDIALNNVQLNEQFNISKDSLIYTGKISINSRIDFNGNDTPTSKNKFTIEDFQLLRDSSQKENILEVKVISGKINYNGTVASISIEDKKTNKLKIDLDLKDNLTSPYGKAKIKLDATVLEFFPELFPFAKGEIHVEVSTKGKLFDIKANSKNASIGSSIIEQNIKHFEIEGIIAPDDKHSINGKATTETNELVFFNIAYNESLLSSKFSTDSIAITASKDNKLISKIQGAYSLSLLDGSSSLDILADINSAKISLVSDSNEDHVEDISNDIIFIKNKTIYKAEPTKKKESKVFKLSAKQPVILVDGDGFNAKVKGNLDITQDNSGSYYANGLLIIDKGKYKNLGKIFIVKRGSILYLPNTPINNPIISIQLEQQTISAGEEHLSIWLYGPINKLRASFSHDQHFSFKDDSINSQASLIAAQMANASGKSIASQLQSSLKLDELSLESSNNSHDPSVDNMVVSVGKQLSKKIYVKLKKDISGNETDKSNDAVALKYKLNKNFSLNLESSTQNNEVSIQFSHEDG